MTAIITLVILLIGALIAARQMWIANDKIDFEIYQAQRERRFAIFAATRELLASVFDDDFAERKISEESIRAYGLHALDSQFLFDDSVYKYLRELHQRVSTWHQAKTRFEKVASEDDLKAQQQIAADQIAWLTKEGDEHTGFAVRFKPFLSYARPKPPWPLRWPPPRWS